MPRRKPHALIVINQSSDVSPMERLRDRKTSVGPIRPVNIPFNPRDSHTHVFSDKEIDLPDRDTSPPGGDVSHETTASALIHVEDSPDVSQIGSLPIHWRAEGDFDDRG